MQPGGNLCRAFSRKGVPVKTIAAVALLLAGLALAEPQDHLGPIKVGKPFPDRTGFDAMHPKGDLISPQEMLKAPGIKHVFVAFFQTTCAPCLVEIEQLHAQKALLHQKGIDVLLVGVKEEPADLRRLVSQRKWDFPVLADRFEGDYSHQCGVINAKEELDLPAAALLSRNAKGDMILKAAWKGSEKDIVARILEAAP